MKKSLIPNQANQWLKSLNYQYQKISKVSDDASNRKYYRLHKVNQNSEKIPKNLIVLISPPEKENNSQFINIAEKLCKNQIKTVEIINKNKTSGYFVLSDLGKNRLYDYYLKDQFLDKTLDYYSYALTVLAQFKNQSDSLCKNLKSFNSNLIELELNLFDEWFIDKTLSPFSNSIKKEWNQMKNEVYQKVSKNFLDSPTGFTHRDFHSKNLMIQRKKTLAVIDFQDALIGPNLYDLASLLKDSYISLPTTVFNILMKKAYEIYKNDFQDYDEFLKTFLWICIQRHIKVIGIFCRLNLRDNKKQYLSDIPLTLHNLITEVGQFFELTDFKNFLTQSAEPLWYEFALKENLK